MEKYNKNIQPQEDEDENINLRQILEQYLFYWKWFVLSLIICIIGAFLYLRYTPKQYQVTAKILLNEKENVSGELAALAEVNPFSNTSNSNITDQIEILQSRRLITKVVSNNNLNIKYYSIGKINTTQLSESESPIKIILLNDSIKTSTDIDYSFKINILSNTKFEVTDVDTNESNTYSFGNKIKSNLGSFIITPNTSFKDNEGQSLLIKVNSIENTVSSLIKKIQITPNNEKTSKIINFSQTSAAPLVAEIFINQLIDQYNYDLVEDNSRLTKATTLFINDRLKK